jgi:hypothetical protein
VAPTSWWIGWRSWVQCPCGPGTCTSSSARPWGRGTRCFSILHLLDKPEAIWDDPGADHIYGELRAEFDLVDRYQALELKLRSVRDALELITDVARDRRLVLLEAAIVLCSV